MKIGIVGSRRYENRKRIKDFIFKIKQEAKKSNVYIVIGAIIFFFVLLLIVMMNIM